MSNQTFQRSSDQALVENSSDASSSDSDSNVESSIQPSGPLWKRQSSDELGSASSGGGQPYNRTTSSSFESVYGATPENGSNHDATTVEPIASAENERQILLLMLLAQVCALHDPTPRTFTVHVLELYERGILDRESIGFLFDLGLVPNKGTSPTKALLTSGEDIEETAIVVRRDPRNSRAEEASAIRSRLEREESEASSCPTASAAKSESQPTAKSGESRPLSWGVEHHPLSLSRYQREFRQIKLLAAGSFGSVFHALNKLDGRDYAVKRVIFNEKGYSNDSVTQVVREVQCLAHCSHPHVVRYHTSWLEPSWVTGSGTAVSSADDVASKQVQRRLLTDIHQMVLEGPGGNEESETSSRFDFSQDSEWESTYGAGSSEGYMLQQWNEPVDASAKPPAGPRKGAYRYQMCFFIQMQLCKPSTLADWIRQRNQSDVAAKDFFEPAMEIFSQLVQGLDHVHAADIVHRDMKPSNCFESSEGLFKIGDFGLSRLLRNAATTDTTNSGMVLAPSPLASLTNGGWQDPLTMGVGTASYCSPEQVSSSSYGSEADIFSLGLILLELFCRFDTEHERIHTFHDCRRGNLPTKVQSMYPEVGEIILSCTDADPVKRPSARELARHPHIHRSNDRILEVQGLRGKLAEKNVQLEQKLVEIEEKDRIIEELRSQMARMSSNGAVNAAPTPSPTAGAAALQYDVVDVETFSDSDY